MRDYIDTDAIIPALACLDDPTNAELGNHCFEVFEPDFRHAVRAGSAVLVAGKAFGCGSPREEAPRALKGLGVKCVIARSFAYIFARNMPNIGMLAITIADDDFYDAAEHGASIEVDVERCQVAVDGNSWSFSLGSTELGLIKIGGLGMALKTFGDDLFGTINPRRLHAASESIYRAGEEVNTELEW